MAIQNIRYVPLISPTQNGYETLNASPPSYCWGAGPGSVYPPTVNPPAKGPNVAVWCSTQSNPYSSTTRIVTISACVIPSSVTIGSSNWMSLATSCAGSPGLQTVVSFDDFDNNTTACQPTCGTGMTIVSSSRGATDPTVTGLSTQPTTVPPSGPITGGTPLTITGSGFVSGSTTVFLVDPTAVNLVTTIAPASVTFNSATSISITTPAVTTVAQYNVVVSTPNGISLNGPAFTYSPVHPTITGLSPTIGSANGGTAVTIDGTGFLSNAVALGSTTVTFTDTAPSTNCAATPTLCPAAQDVSVNSSGTVITATAPSIITGTTYYVTVSTNPGYPTALSTSWEFTFQPYYPVADSITPATGAGGPSVTITGLGFLAGGTAVNLIPTTGNGNSLMATGVSVSSPTSLTAQLPSETTGAYYVSVTTTWSGTPYQSCAATANGNVPSCSGEGAPTYTY